MNEYKRLTKRQGNGVCYSTEKYEITCYPMNNNLSEVDKIAVRLCELEDKIENGTLVELPCNDRADTLKQRIANQREEIRRLKKCLNDTTQSRDYWKDKAERIGKQLNRVLEERKEK